MKKLISAVVLATGLLVSGGALAQSTKTSTIPWPAHAYGWYMLCSGVSGTYTGGDHDFNYDSHCFIEQILNGKLSGLSGSSVKNRKIIQLIRRAGTDFDEPEILITGRHNLENKDKVISSSAILALGYATAHIFTGLTKKDIFIADRLLED